MTLADLLATLDPDQRAATLATGNTVVAAGAGSGKTRVLAARYLYLVLEKGLPIDRVLALTFTQKAAAEMKARIHKTLRETEHPLARSALEGFHEARISTIDSLCGAIARSACRRWGIPPDFQLDDPGAREAASSLALPFVFTYRTHPAIKHLLSTTDLEKIAENLFASLVAAHSPISAPIDFRALFVKQDTEIHGRIDSALTEACADLNEICRLAQAPGLKTMKSITPITDLQAPDKPSTDDRDELISFRTALSRFAAIPLRMGATKQPEAQAIKELLSTVRNRHDPECGSLISFVLNRDVLEGLFTLLDEFQTLYNTQKRQSGRLTFADVAKMAVDALADDPELRRSWKAGVGAVMIDEFQDNNSLQRDLLFLLSENETRMETGIPGPQDLCRDKLFFVGDEKQSIYRFRGADVAVFRALARDLGANADALPELSTNYRTRTALLEQFNTIFPAIFDNAATAPDWEARFSRIRPNRPDHDTPEPVQILVIDQMNLDDEDNKKIKAQIQEAECVARTIQDLIESAVPVYDAHGIPHPCRADDCAILFRSTTNQMLFEHSLRAAGIPYQTENARGLFSDAPVNDLAALMRTIANPADLKAWAIVLQSPFAGLSGTGFASALSALKTIGGSQRAEPAAVSAAVDALLTGEDSERWKGLMDLFSEAVRWADRIPISEMVERLWYHRGYRVQVLSDPSVRHLTALFDYLFELARQADRDGQTLGEFLDRIEAIRRNEEKVDSLDIPIERAGGVRLMTIHKSKGLEFPIVFLANCDTTGKNTGNSSLVYWSNPWGPTINAGPARGVPFKDENWFYLQGKAEEESKALAELRRLLYVGMTRAESRLYLSGVFKLDGGDETVAGQMAAKEPKIIKSFFNLFCPVLGLPGAGGVQVTAWEQDSGGPAARGIEGPSVKDMHTAARAAEVQQRLPAPRRIIPATSLAHEAERISFQASQHVQKEPERFGLSATEFGSAAHEAIEARLAGRPAVLPETAKSALEELADTFLASDLGHLTSAAAWLKTEYAFLTRWELPSGSIIVSGQIDLVFEHEGHIHVVDYKTDSVENPDEHRQQLEVYRKAAVDLWHKPVSAWIFYLRSARAVQVTP